jgi:hypothetical protein
VSERSKQPKLEYRGEIHAAVRKWMEGRSVAFGKATSSRQGKPPDGVTYGAGKGPRGESQR